MNWQDALAYIESPELDAELNFASGTSAFFRRVGKEPVIQSTLGLMSESGEVCEEVLGRIFDLSVAETDPDYANPNDSPLAVLLWLTYFTNPNYARIGANFVDGAPRCWYAKWLAHRIINPIPTASSDSWLHIGTATQISHRSSSDAESLNTVSPTTRVRVTMVPSIGVPENTVHQAWRQISQWVEHTRYANPERIPFSSAFTVGDLNPILNTEGWYPARDYPRATGVGP